MQHALEEVAIRQRVDALSEAIRAMDLEAVKSFYAPDIVSFDIEPPLQHVGAKAKWKNWAGVFAARTPPLGYELRNLKIITRADIAFGYSLNRIHGTLKNGHKSDHWVRSTLCFQKIAGTWLIVHDHVSAPLDMQSGRAWLELEPLAAT